MGEPNSDAAAKSAAGLGVQKGNASASTSGVPPPPAAASGTQAVPPPPAAAATAAEVPVTQSEAPGTALAVVSKPKVPTTSKTTTKGMPSILSELGLKATSRGIMLPESRKTTLLRIREQRRLGIVPLQDRKREALMASEGGEGKKRKIKQKANKKFGVALDQEHSDLFHAAFIGDWGACRNLTSNASLDVNVRTNADLDGVGTAATALHVAAMRGHEDVVTVLLHARADVTARSGRGEIAIDLATRSGEVAVVKALRAAGGAPPDVENTMKLIDKAPAWDHHKRKQLHSALAPSPWAVGAPPGKRREPMPSGEGEQGRPDGEDAPKGGQKGAPKGEKRQRTKKGKDGKDGKGSGKKGGKGGSKDGPEKGGGDWGKGGSKDGPEKGGGDWGKGGTNKGW